MAEDQSRSIASRVELERLIDDRRNDPPVPELNHPKPSWMLDAEDPKRKHIRMRERRIRYLARRLDKATMEMEQEFDHEA